MASIIVRELINLIGFKVNESQLRSAERTVDRVTRKLDRFGTRLSLGFTLPFTILTKKLGQTLSEFEQIDVAFETIIGDADRAAVAVESLLQLAAKTPFNVLEITDSARQLLAVGIEVENLNDVLTDLGNVASGVNSPLERIILNFGQVKTQGKLTGRELRDFLVARVPLVQELAKSLNVAEKEIADMVSRGEIGFEDVRQAFKNMARDGGRFADLMIKQSKTLGGLWSNLVDRIMLMARGMSKQLIPVFKRVVLLFSDFVRVFDKLDPRLKAFLFWLGAGVATLGPLSLGLSLLIKLFSVLAIKIAVIAAPIIALIGLVGLLADDLIAFVKGGRSIIGSFIPPWDQLQKRMGDFFNFAKKGFQGFLKGFERIKEGFDLIFRGLQLGYDDMVEEGLNQLSDGAAMMAENFINVFIKVVEKLSPKLTELVVVLTPIFTQIGVALGKGLMQGIFSPKSVIGKSITKLNPQIEALAKKAVERRKAAGKPGGFGFMDIVEDLQSKLAGFVLSTNPQIGLLAGNGQNIVPTTAPTNGKITPDVNITMNMEVPRDTTENTMDFINEVAEKAGAKIAKQVQLTFLRNE